MLVTRKQYSVIWSFGNKMFGGTKRNELLFCEMRRLDQEVSKAPHSYKDLQVWFKHLKIKYNMLSTAFKY